MNLLEYRSIADMNRLILENLYKLSHDIDLVVGVPRSGMLPANLIALYLNKPFTDINSFVSDGRIYLSGERGNGLDISNIKKILLVDDSIASGKAMSKAKEYIAPVADRYEVTYGVVFAMTSSKDQVDFYCEIIDAPRVFQWNIFHHSLLNKACFDMDGVLCVDPPVDDDGPQYLDYIENAIPLYIPTVTIDTIVTCRLEKYRQPTEAWLDRHHIKYNRLVMLPFSTKAERIKWGKHGEYKGKTMKESGNILFVESSLEQAHEINHISCCPVFCTETFSLIDRNKEIKLAQFRTKESLKSMVKTTLGRNYSKVIDYLRRHRGVNACDIDEYTILTALGHNNDYRYARA